MSRYFLPALAAAAVAAAPMAHAITGLNCDVGDCTLGSAGAPTDVQYGGVAPFFTDWKASLPFTIDGGTNTAAAEDSTSPFTFDAHYVLGDVTGGGTDANWLNGATVNDFALGSFIPDNPASTVNGESFNALSVMFNNVPGDPGGIYIDTLPGIGTNYEEVGGQGVIGSADWFQWSGSTTPTLLWDSLGTPNAFPTALFNPADYLPHDVWAPDIAGLVAGTL